MLVTESGIEAGEARRSDSMIMTTAFTRCCSAFWWRGRYLLAALLVGLSFNAFSLAQSEVSNDKAVEKPVADAREATESESEPVFEAQSRELLQMEALRKALGSPDISTDVAVNRSAAPQGSTGGDVIKSPPRGTTNEWGVYTPNLGFKVADTAQGDLSVSIYTYARYLNQNGLDPTFQDAFGNTKTLQRRQDIQLQKVQFKFLGWIMSEKLRYFLYAWTSNANQGLDAQVVLAGNLNYSFGKPFTLGFGITSLPGTRSVEGNFPFWLSVDSRLIADEFFRPSYTTGIFARGQLTDRLRYQIMLGNNLSTLGVSAAQLDNGLNTVSSALVWSTKEFNERFGDFDDHQQPAIRLAAHFSRSDENKESQPSEEAPENTQLRLSDGGVIFTPNLFGPGITITDARYKMAAVDGAFKYRGFALEGEYFWRRLDNFRGQNTDGLPKLSDQGVQVQGSAMAIPRTLQLYTGYSKIFGQYGQPWDTRGGINWFPWKNKVVRFNAEALYLHKSPVGYTSVPFAVGGRGLIFHTNLEMAF